MPTPQVIITPEASTTQLAEAVIELQRILTRGLGIGDAGEGQEYPRTTVGTPRPKTKLAKPDNLFGNMVEITIDTAADLGINLECTHGLNLPVPAVRTAGIQQRSQILNVRWLVGGVRYLSDNATVATNAGDPYHRFLVLYSNGVVGANSVELRFYSNLVVAGAQTGAIRVTLFFFPASK